MPVILTRKSSTACGKLARASATWRRPCGTIFPSGACSARSRRHAPPLSHTASTRHASDTRIGLMDSTVQEEALVSGVTHPR